MKADLEDGFLENVLVFEFVDLLVHVVRLQVLLHLVRDRLDRR